MYYFRSDETDSPMKQKQFLFIRMIDLVIVINIVIFTIAVVRVVDMIFTVIVAAIVGQNWFITLIRDF